MWFSEEDLALGQLYWMRNLGTTLKAAEVVYKDGSLYYQGVSNEDKTTMVCPVVKIRLQWVILRLNRVRSS